MTWSKPVITEDALEISLSYGEWVNHQLIRPYKAIINWRNWSKAKKNYVLMEVEIARLEYIAAHKSGGKERGWVFFIGNQIGSDIEKFHIDDHRLICCLVAEMVYPNFTYAKL